MIYFPGFDMELPQGRSQSVWDIELLMLTNVAKHMKGFNEKALNSSIWITLKQQKGQHFVTL